MNAHDCNIFIKFSAIPVMILCHLIVYGCNIIYGLYYTLDFQLAFYFGKSVF